MEKISVYIPCFNADRFIESAVNSVLGQTLPPDEVLVIDDGCTDRSMDVIAKYPVRIVHMETNQGLLAARNRAYVEARNELIASIDADCQASPNWLAELCQSFPKSCAGTGGKTIEANQSKAADRWRALHMPLHWGDKGVMNPKVIYGANQMFRREALLRAGFLDPTKVVRDYKIGGTDWQLTQKLYRGGYSLFYNPRAIVYHLRTDTPLSVIRTYWRWSVFYYPEPHNLARFGFKMGVNLSKTIKHAFDDMVRRTPSLIPISAMIFPFHTYYDFKFLCEHHYGADL